VIVVVFSIIINYEVVEVNVVVIHVVVVVDNMILLLTFTGGYHDDHEEEEFFGYGHAHKPGNQNKVKGT